MGSIIGGVAVAAATVGASAALYSTCAVSCTGCCTGAAAGTAAATAASALLAKYGLDAQRSHSKQEVHIGNMRSADPLEVKDACDAPLKACVEIVIATSHKGEEIDLR